MSNTQELIVFLDRQKQDIEAFLDQVLPQPQPNNRLYAAMRYSALNNGKRLRPALVYACGIALGVAKQHLDAVAGAVELIHCYSLIHDDLPAMDNDDLRRGVPTCHKAFDEATAILAGDALQTLAFQILCDQSLNPVSPEQQIKMISYLAKAAGPMGMILGQAQDMAAEKQNLSLEALIELHSNKTGKLFEACIELSLIAGGRQDEQQVSSRLRDYAKNIGLAFQIQDDILDVVGNKEALGKNSGTDQAADKATFPKILGLVEAQAYAEITLEKALTAIRPLGSNGHMLGFLAQYIMKRDR